MRRGGGGSVAAPHPALRATFSREGRRAVRPSPASLPICSVRAIPRGLARPTAAAPAPSPRGGERGREGLEADGGVVAFFWLGAGEGGDGHFGHGDGFVGRVPELGGFG